jgi:hypothetical protein
MVGSEYTNTCKRRDGSRSNQGPMWARQVRTGKVRICISSGSGLARNPKRRLMAVAVVIHIARALQ